MERIDSIKIKVTRKKKITEDYFLLNEMTDGLVIVQSKENELYGVIRGYRHPLRMFRG